LEGTVWRAEPFGERQEPYGRIAGTLEPTVWRGRNRSASRQLLPRLEAVAVPPPRGCWRASCRGPAGSRPAAERLLRQEPSSNRARPHHSDTEPAENACICRHLHFNVSAPFCSAGKRLTTRTRTCRGRAPETSPDHRTRVPTNLRQIVRYARLLKPYAGASYKAVYLPPGPKNMCACGERVSSRLDSYGHTTWCIRAS
jgi:hypothetical protein